MPTDERPYNMTFTIFPENISCEPIDEPLPYGGEIDHPSYYQGKIEVIDFIEDKNLGFHLGNAIKYIARAGRKSPDTEVEDLRKAIWHIERYIKIKEGHNANDR